VDKAIQLGKHKRRRSCAKIETIILRGIRKRGWETKAIETREEKILRLKVEVERLLPRPGASEGKCEE